MAKCLKIPAPTGVFVFDLTEALQDGLGGFFVYCLSLFVFCVLSFVGRGCAFVFPASRIVSFDDGISIMAAMMRHREMSFFH